MKKLKECQSILSFSWFQSLISIVIVLNKEHQVSPCPRYSQFWTLENSETLGTLRMRFISQYRSFVMKITPSKYFEDFVISISHFMLSRLDLKFPLPNTEEEDELIEEPSFNCDSFLPAFYGNQLCIEEGKTSAQNDSNFNLNSKNFSAEEAQLSLKNIFNHSSQNKSRLFV